jgi:DNA-binding transcriptional MerR regulator
MSGQSTYTLAELSELTGIPRRTIRFYTTEGLLPRPLTRGRYASYTQAHLDRLLLIDTLKRSYLPLAAIKEQLGALSDEQVSGLATPSEASAVIQQAGRHSTALGTPERLRVGTSVYAHAQSVRAAVAPPVPRVSRMESTPTPETESEGWRRFPVAPGIEIHARAGLPPEMERSLEMLVTAARQRIRPAYRGSRPPRPHAHPRNFALARHIDRGWGELAFEYWWEASDGSSPGDSGELDSLSHCVLYEVTGYAGNEGAYTDGWYIPPEPPFAGWRFRDPTDGRTAEVGMECFVATHGRAWDRHKIGGRLLPPVEPATFSFKAVQTYRFYCDECGLDEVIPGPRGGPHEIVRTFAPSPTHGLWRYTVSKHDFSAWMDVDEAGFVADSLGLEFGPW